MRAHATPAWVNRGSAADNRGSAADNRGSAADNLGSAMKQKRRPADAKANRIGPSVQRVRYGRLRSRWLRSHGSER